MPGNTQMPGPEPDRVALSPPKPKPGPKRERLKINEVWENAVARAESKPVPPGGVPEKPKPTKRKKKPFGKKG